MSYNKKEVQQHNKAVFNTWLDEANKTNVKITAAVTVNENRQPGLIVLGGVEKEQIIELLELMAVKLRNG